MKKLLRKWLKRQIIKAHANSVHETFEWIYNSPMSTWRDRLFCVRNQPYFGNSKRYYDWLTSNSISPKDL